MKKLLLISLLCISAVSVLAEKTSYCGLPINARVGALEEGVPVYEYPQQNSRKVGATLNLYLGGYSAEVPPLPIPNRVVKLSNADGTAFVGE